MTANINLKGITELEISNATGGGVSKGVASITVEGDGDATSIQGIPVDPTPPSHNGELLIYDSMSGSYVPGDPLCQGIQAEGTAASTVNPILVAGKDGSGNLKDFVLDSSGRLGVNVNGTVPISGTVAVSSLPATPAGTNVIGKVGIDQTTPGTTNKVSIGTDGTVAINAALPAGTNLIGKTGIDQTTPGTTNKVSIGTDGTVAINAALPAGTNTIGTVKNLGANAELVIADNLLNTVTLPDSAAANAPLYSSDSAYGGAFSGTADTARQGWSKVRQATVFKTGTVSLTSTTAVTIWTPGSGNKFRLLGFQITAQGLAATGATSGVTVELLDGSTPLPVGIYDFEVPAASGLAQGTQQISGGAVNLGGFGILSSAANNVVAVKLSSSPTGAVGTFRATVWGVEE